MLVVTITQLGRHCQCVYTIYLDVSLLTHFNNNTAFPFPPYPCIIYYIVRHFIVRLQKLFKMRLSPVVVTTTWLLPLVYGRTSGDLCVGTAHESDGNWYCAEVQKIVYRDISQAGTYNRTTGMNVEQGICYHEPVDYPATGPLTPLFGEVWILLAGSVSAKSFNMLSIGVDAYPRSYEHLSACGLLFLPVCCCYKEREG